MKISIELEVFDGSLISILVDGKEQKLQQARFQSGAIIYYYRRGGIGSSVELIANQLDYFPSADEIKDIPYTDIIEEEEEKEEEA